jgi:hypothetical protein
MELNQDMKPPEPSAVILEIRARMAKLDRVDEIVEAINSMCDAVGCSRQLPLARHSLQEYDSPSLRDFRLQP